MPRSYKKREGPPRPPERKRTGGGSYSRKEAYRGKNYILVIILILILILIAFLIFHYIKNLESTNLCYDGDLSITISEDDEVLLSSITSNAYLQNSKGRTTENLYIQTNLKVDDDGYICSNAGTYTIEFSRLSLFSNQNTITVQVVITQKTKIICYDGDLTISISKDDEVLLSSITSEVYLQTPLGTTTEGLYMQTNLEVDDNGYISSPAGTYSIEFSTFSNFSDRNKITIKVVIEESPTIYSYNDMTITFLELGNAYTGDCTFIQIGTIDILIDAGSKTNSISTITAYLDSHMKDDVLEYVIVTHAHEDHYAGFATNDGTESILDRYEVGTLIDFAQTNQKDTAKMYNNYLRERSEAIERGTVHYTALECIEEEHNIFQITDNVTMEILDSKYYHEKDSSGENNHSVCTLFTNGDQHYLFTGDLEAKGEKELVIRNDIPHCELYKAGHHGSKTSSSEELLEKCTPDVVCVCCCCGSAEYTDVDANQFPTQDFVDRVAPYTDKVYVTTICKDWESKTFESMNGNITVSITEDVLTVSCSNSNKILKEWEWFQLHRTLPDAWK